MLRPGYAKRFARDIKRLQRKHTDLAPLREVMSLVIEDSDEARRILRQLHKAHRLQGTPFPTDECHVANAGDWLLLWSTRGDMVVFQRTGTHEEVLGNFKDLTQP
ncbi:MAG: type II toxin-antitoxin system mRNA interferase toxin, RelE/StbE family [Bifidobacterium sp.]|nr:type II toxin-antitoxin system mRNA interferase toxin, RelE/StbE family [Bifidobacterium sp.]